MIFALITLGAFCVGLLYGIYIAISIHRRLCKRLAENRNTEHFLKDRQSRTLAMQFDRDTLAPPGAGPAGHESILFAVKLGALAEFNGQTD